LSRFIGRAEPSKKQLYKYASCFLSPLEGEIPLAGREGMYNQNVGTTERGLK
jgi:hypothetical protein